MERDSFAFRQLEQVADETHRRRKSRFRDELTRGSRARGYWIAQGLEPPIDLPPPGVGEPPTVELSLLRAREAFSAGDLWMAVAWIGDVLRSDPTTDQAAEALRMRAMAWARLDFHGDAIEDAEAALELVPDATTGSVSSDDLRSRLISWIVFNR